MVFFFSLGLVAVGKGTNWRVDIAVQLQTEFDRIGSGTRLQLTGDHQSPDWMRR